MGDQISFAQFYQATTVPAHAVLICSLGQAGFLIKGGGKVFLIDPYLSNAVEEENPLPEGLFTRMFPPPVNPDELTGIDLIFVTHDHRDHCDPATIRPILQKNPGCRVIAPPSSIKELEKAGISSASLLSCNLERWRDEGDLAYMAIPAAHPEVQIDREGNSNTVGYVLSIDGINLYHSGDTVSYEGLTEKIRAALQPIHVACIVINGRDESREGLGIIGNLTPSEALGLAKGIGVDLMIPMHNDLFAGNSTDPQELTKARTEEYPDQNVLWLRAGDAFLFTK